MNSYIILLICVFISSFFTACKSQNSLNMGNSQGTIVETDVSTYKPPHSPTPSRVKNVRSNISKSADRHINSTEWAFESKKDDFPKETYKCNKFVYDVLKESGASPPTKKDKNEGTWPIQARDWATLEQGNKSWQKMKPGTPIIPGDVVSQERRSQRATGHCGIAIGHGNKNDIVGASKCTITRGSHGFKENATVTRYMGSSNDWIQNVGTFDHRTIRFHIPGDDSVIKLPGVNIRLCKNNN